MQKYGQDLLDISFSYFTCYDTTILSPHIRCSATSAFCMHIMHNTTYDALIVASLRLVTMGSIIH
jgi:hypothetical protein